MPPAVFERPPKPKTASGWARMEPAVSAPAYRSPDASPQEIMILIDGAERAMDGWTGLTDARRGSFLRVADIRSS